MTALIHPFVCVRAFVCVCVHAYMHVCACAECVYYNFPVKMFVITQVADYGQMFNVNYGRRPRVDSQ